MVGAGEETDVKISGIKGRTALVTGAGRGIGRAIAIALAAEGARVALSARTRSELDETAEAIRAAGGEAVAFEADLAERKAPGQLVAAVEAALGPVEILVNNAGVGSSSNPKPVVDFDDDFWDLSLAVNMTPACRRARSHAGDVEEGLREVEVRDQVSLFSEPLAITPGQRTSSGVRSDSSYIQRLSNQPCSPR